MKFYSFFIIIIYSSLSFLYCQENDFKSDSLLIEEGVEKKNNFFKNLINKKDTLNPKLPNIKKYVIININADSTYLDTTLSIKKHYKFNYLRKDNFELLNFSNIGQTYNELTHNFDFSSFFPKFSFYSKSHAYLKSNEVKYFQVPTPLTELLFKTVMKQGQYTDAFFSSNVSQKLNFSIAFKGLRSLGNYQNILSGSKQFRFTTKYNSTNNRYNFKFHFVSQGFENQENGGLVDEAISNFESKDPLFNERSKLSVKFEDATNYFSSKRYYLDHQFLLTKKKDSIQKNSFSIGHRFEYETTSNVYEQDQPSEFYGMIKSGLNGINDKSQIKTTLNEFYTDLNSNLFGKIQVIYTNYNYRYKTNSLSNEFEGFNQNENALSINFKKNIFGHNLKTTISNGLFGERLGNLINISVFSNNEKILKYQFGLNISSKHPGFYYEKYGSSYTNLNWNNNIKKEKIRNIFLNFKFSKFGDFCIDLRSIENYTYFISSSAAFPSSFNKTLIPIVNQLESDLDYLKIRWDREFKFGKFAIDNSFIYQNVNQNGDYLNLPEIISRNTLYYSNTILKGAMFFQTGISLKYFSKYFANEYNPAVSSFYVQNQKKIGGFPLIDLFVNAKIKQTRLFLKVEHFNSTLTGNNFYSSPSYPYRDFIIRFGLVWNFFN